MAGSAWKQFFFFDCLGMAGLMGRAREGPELEGLGQLRTSNSKANSLSTSGAGSKGKLSRLASATSAATASGPASVKIKSKPKRKRPASAAVRSPSNKALLQTDPLFHLYLICVGLITLSILAIKCLIPGMPIYSHTVLGFAFLLAIILVSTIYTQVKSKKVSRLVSLPAVS